MKEYDTLTDNIQRFVLEQKVFWVGSAPASTSGLVNVSPKGLGGTFGFVSNEAAKLASKGKFPSGEKSKCLVAFMDIGGSGIETVAHLQENGRITLLFCSFGQTPLLVRFFGHGICLEPGDVGFDEVSRCAFEPEVIRTYHALGQESKLRNIILVDVERIRDSCGYGVPIMDYVADRTVFSERFANWDKDFIEKRRLTAMNNVTSIDGLPGLPRIQHLTTSAPASSSSTSSSCPVVSITSDLKSATSPPPSGCPFAKFAINSTSLSWFFAGIGITLVAQAAITKARS